MVPMPRPSSTLPSQLLSIPSHCSRAPGNTFGLLSSQSTMRQSAGSTLGTPSPSASGAIVPTSGSHATHALSGGGVPARQSRPLPPLMLWHISSPSQSSPLEQSESVTQVTWQSGSQPSPEVSLPSSHSSPVSVTPSPQLWGTQRPFEQCPMLQGVPLTTGVAVQVWAF